MSGTQVRFDSIWRRTKADDYAAKLEGQFRDSRERLAELNNWGSLAWLYPHATATKLAHHYGVEHNAQHFLDADETRDRYRPSFRIASHVLHWGHVPLSYAGAEGITRASHVDEHLKKVLESVLREVVAFGSLRCTDDGHREECFSDVLEGDRPFELYKWLSAWLVARRWKRIWKAVKPLVPDHLDEDTIKQETIRTLVCREDFGYQLLDLCRLADYIPRDLRQAGTAWLSVDIEALWEVSPLRPDRAPEWSLLSASRSYLEDRFFVSPDAQLIHSLAGRVIAQGLLNQGLTKEGLLALLTSGAGDAHYFSTFADYHRRRLRQVEKWAKGEQLGRLWRHIGTFRNIQMSLPRLDAEDSFSGRTGSGRLSYPLSSNYSAVVERGSRDPVGERRVISLCLHHRDDPESSSARPALDIALDAQRRQRFVRDRDLVNSGVAGWLASQRIETRSRETRRVGGVALGLDQERSKELLVRVQGHSALDPDRNFTRLRIDLRRAASLGLPEFLTGRTVLELPLGVARSKAGVELFDFMKEKCLQLASEGEKSLRGYALEAAVAADQLLSPDDCVRRILLLGPTALSEEGKPTTEWDVWRLDLLKGRDWRLAAIECTIAQTAQKEEEERDRLEGLRLSLQGRFGDLLEYQTRLAGISNGKLTYTDAARGFTRT
jgi:hypothetical protein